MPRLFVAIDLPIAAKAALERLAFGVPGARWMTDDQLHLTLSFIGEVGGSEQLDIEERLGEIALPNFEISLAGIGHFPPRGNPKVIWVGVEKNEALMRLQKKIETALKQIGIVPEERKYSPHITLARLKDTPYPRVGQYLEQNGLFRYPPFQAQAFHLFESTLSQSGSHYEIIATYQLDDLR